MAIVSEEKFEQIVSIPMTVLGGLQPVRTVLRRLFATVSIPMTVLGGLQLLAQIASDGGKCVSIPMTVLGGLQRRHGHS